MTAAKIVFRDAGPYAQGDLEHVAGLHAGSRMVLADLQAAAQRLADTGCFDEVKIDSQGAASALTVIFLLKPSAAGEVHPVEFANLVWFTPEELQGIVHKAAPLSAGGLPELTAVLDAVSAGLESALAAKGVAGATVSHSVVTASSSAPRTAVVFRVQRPYVQLGAVTLEGASGVMAPAEAKVISVLKGKPFTAGTEPWETEGLLLDPYRNRGYLEARLEDVSEKVQASADGRGVSVDVNAKVVEGAGPYRVGALEFAGSPLVPANAWEGMVKLHPGDVASRQLLLALVAPIDRTYHKQGYMDEYVDFGAKLDGATHTVGYALKVVPGAAYALKSVTVQGLSPEAKAEFDAAWKMKAGDPYDADYVKGFVEGNKELHAVAGYAGSFSAAADPATHEVDLTVVFAAGRR